MSTAVRDLIARGALAIRQQLGTAAELSRGGEVYWSGLMVWVEVSSGYAVELGGSVYSVSGRGTVLEADMDREPLPGDRLRVNGRLFIIVGVFRSPYDCAYNIEASLLSR